MDLSTVSFDKSKLIVGRQSVISFTDGAGVQQVTTATAAGAITTSGNLTATLTAAGLAGSPIALSVAVLNGDTPSMWAQKVRLALAANAVIAAVWEVLAALDATITLRRRVAAANDATLNLALADGTSDGCTEAATSAATTAGAASGPVTNLLVEYVSHAPGLSTSRAKGPGANNGPAFTAKVWASDRAEMFKFRSKEIAKIITLLGSLSGLKEGTVTLFVRDPSDAALKVALKSDDFPCSLYRDQAEMEASAANPSEVTLVIESLKDGAVELNHAATA